MNPEDPDEKLLHAHHAAASSVLRYSSTEPLRLEGWLAKEGKSLRARRARYITLSDQLLSSHRSKHSPQSWQISIADAIVDKGSHPREIKITLPHRTISFTAPSIQLYQTWIIALRRASVATSRVDDFYRVGRLIGEGMNGHVRLAQDMLTDENLAVKIVPRLGRENETEFLAREVQIILSISHPNIVRTVDVFIRSRRIHFVMEYLAGGELFDFIAEHTHFTEMHAASVMVDLLQALVYLHTNGIAHRDVKLENLLCANSTWPLNVKLADFGFANYVSQGCEPTLSSFVGTPYYIAPEMLRGDPHGLPVDIWASGVVMYILLSGKFPFGGKNESEYYQRVLSKEAYFPDEEWSKISDEAKDLVRGMLCRDPRKRYTAEQCLRHSWLKRGDSVREPGEADIFPTDTATDELASPEAFRDNQEKKGKRRYLGMLNRSLTKPTDDMIAARDQHGKKSRTDTSPKSHKSMKDVGKSGSPSEDSDVTSVNRRPSLIRRLISSGKLSLDRYDGRFPSFRGGVEETGDEASSTPRKTLSLFAKDGPLRRSFHRVGEGRCGDDGINFVNSQSQRLPPKIARERQRQQKQAEAARKASRGSGIFSSRKETDYSGQSGYHSSPRLQSHLAHPFHRVPTAPGQRTMAPTRWKRAATHSNHLKREEEVMRIPMMARERLETDSPVSSSADEDMVRRTVSADVALVERQFCDTQIAKMDLLTGRTVMNHGKFYGNFGRRGFRV